VLFLSEFVRVARVCTPELVTEINCDGVINGDRVRRVQARRDKRQFDLLCALDCQTHLSKAAGFDDNADAG
jgi:hypothetical protein